MIEIDQVSMTRANPSQGVMTFELEGRLGLYSAKVPFTVEIQNAPQADIPEVPSVAPPHFDLDQLPELTQTLTPNWSM